MPTIKQAVYSENTHSAAAGTAMTPQFITIHSTRKKQSITPSGWRKSGWWNSKFIQGMFSGPDQIVPPIMRRRVSQRASYFSGKIKTNRASRDKPTLCPCSPLWKDQKKNRSDIENTTSKRFLKFWQRARDSNPRGLRLTRVPGELLSHSVNSP